MNESTADGVGFVVPSKVLGNILSVRLTASANLNCTTSPASTVLDAPALLLMDKVAVPVTPES